MQQEWKRHQEAHSPILRDLVRTCKSMEASCFINFSDTTSICFQSSSIPAIGKDEKYVQAESEMKAACKIQK